MKPDGLVVHYGLLSGRPLGEVGRRVEMFRLRDVVHACPRSELLALFEGVFDQLRAGPIVFAGGSGGEPAGVATGAEGVSPGGREVVG